MLSMIQLTLVVISYFGARIRGSVKVVECNAKKLKGKKSTGGIVYELES